MPIHPSAIVDRAAQIDPSADIGPFCIVEAGAVIGPQTRLRSHVRVFTNTSIGARNDIFPFVALGGPPQDLAYKNEPSYLRVGDDNIIREGATLHRGTGAATETVLGSRCFLMANAHVGHNCVVEDDVKLANSAMLGGHVRVGRSAFLGGNSGAHQFVRIGEFVMLGGLTRVTRDVPPFMMMTDFGVTGPNTIGLRRAGFSSEARQEIRRIYRVVFRSGLAFPHAVAQARDLARTDAGRRLLEFLTSQSKRGFHRFIGRTGARDEEREDSA